MKKFKKSKERMLCGVCGGIAEYLNVDPTIIRVAVFVCVVVFAKMECKCYISCFICPLAGEIKKRALRGSFFYFQILLLFHFL